MSKIDQLIQEYCPEGVEFSRLDDLCEIKVGGDTPKKYQKGQMQPSEEFPYPIYSNGTETYGYSDSYKIDNQAVTISSIGNVGWVAFRDAFFTPIIRLKVLIPNDTRILDTKYLYYIMSIQSIVGTNSSLSSINANDVKKLKIPVPPIEVQKEIVNILDKFTQLEAELSAELDARRKQYEYYKNTLLKPDEEVSWKTIGEVCEVGDGNHSSSYPKASEMVEQGIPFIRGTNIVDGTISGKDMKYISEEKHTKLKKGHLKANDVLVTNRGEVGKIAIIPEQFSNSNLNSQIAWLRADTHILLPKYLFFIMNANFIQNKIIGEGGALKQLTIKNLKLLKIPVPPISKQEEVVEVLDSFDKLTNDKMMGIPAEIDARRQQYQYYRTKLLTFQELSA